MLRPTLYRRAAPAAGGGVAATLQVVAAGGPIRCRTCGVVCANLGGRAARSEWPFARSSPTVATHLPAAPLVHPFAQGCPAGLQGALAAWVPA
eukprot:scaffold32295_cov74-Phaeocystis_antarctica.AAC.3